ncbi:hypothetical protein A2272_06450 [Candidatus Peregrinibacteria bacterium RIFOXYA12_FULL_33_12]|nr:MAG: hypothetical protein A2263_00855 [Candidatus Peregrinibacteria bacterium RIFOXYA2_FULL_33_21]OGJ46582.1 MAG: hypothetical protein A2272_06450 [Candidatus Peregrinibacteria bacterium RIFOXYA12_FULL_33_12]OGJ51245.1 MAG: hypothetical protein A2307_01235 [Candidatus Peregrinibacteria bacterium RIFOXYB2_FULL_33_20]
MTVIYHKDFIKHFKKLPKNIQCKAVHLEDLFRDNPFHPSLYTKGLAGPLKRLFLFRITREYRIIFTFSSQNEVLFLDLAHRKDIYR